jgi:hypothetical protein
LELQSFHQQVKQGKNERQEFIQSFTAASNKKKKRPISLSMTTVKMDLGVGSETSINLLQEFENVGNSEIFTKKFV